MNRRSAFGLLLILIVVVVWIVWPRETVVQPASLSTPSQSKEASVSKPAKVAALNTPPETPVSPKSDPQIVASVPVAEPAEPAPEKPNSVEADLDNVQFAIRDFRTALKENPVGSNAEITKAFLGDNLKQVKTPVPYGSSVNGEGELCDRWGTPYFFHQLSANSMEIRSAGPDRKMWTSDDFVTK